MAFIDWLRKGNADRRFQTYEAYWKALCQYFSLLARRAMSYNTIVQLRRVLTPKFRLQVKITS